MRFIPGYWVISYKNPTQKTLLYQEFKTEKEAMAAPKEITIKKLKFSLYGVHGQTSN